MDKPEYKGNEATRQQGIKATSKYRIQLKAQAESIKENAKAPKPETRNLKPETRKLKQ